MGGMKPATLSMWTLLVAFTFFLIKGNIVLRQSPDIEYQLLGTRMLLIASIVLMSAVGCAIIRAETRRTDQRLTAEQYQQAEQEKRWREMEAKVERAAARAPAEFAEAKRRRLQSAIAASSPRKWISLGGTAASEAQLVDYQSGVVTLRKNDGKTVKLRVSRMGKADREFMDGWLANARIEP